MIEKERFTSASHEAVVATALMDSSMARKTAHRSAWASPRATRHQFDASYLSSLPPQRRVAQQRTLILLPTDAATVGMVAGHPCPRIYFAPTIRIPSRIARAVFLASFSHSALVKPA